MHHPLGPQPHGSQAPKFLPRVVVHGGEIVFQAALEKEIGVKAPDQHRAPGGSGDVCAGGGHGEDGAEGGGALPVAREEGEGAPGGAAAAGVEVGGVGAGGRGVVVVGLDEEGVGAAAFQIVLALNGDGEVGGAAHGGVGVVDCDAGAVDAVEGDTY